MKRRTKIGAYNSDTVRHVSLGSAQSILHVMIYSNSNFSRYFPNTHIIIWTARPAAGGLYLKRKKKK